MTLWEGWSSDHQTSAVTRVVHVLLSEASGGLTTRSIEEIITTYGIEVDAHLVFEAAHQAGLVEGHGGIVGNTALPGLPVTYRGNLAYSEFSAAKRPTAERTRVLRRAVLYWLYELPGKRAKVSTELIQDPSGWYFGEQFAEEELNEAFSFLQAQGMLTGQKTWGGDLANVRLTAEGRNCVEEFDGRLELWRNPVQPSSSIKIGTLNNNGNASIGTLGVTNQYSTQAIPDLGSLLGQLVGALRIALLDQGLEPEDASEIRSAVATLGEEADAETPDQGRVREVLNRLSSKFGTMALTSAETGATTLAGAAAKTLAVYLGWSAA